MKMRATARAGSSAGNARVSSSGSAWPAAGFAGGDGITSHDQITREITFAALRELEVD
jgi:hypothetical protein